MTKTFKSDYYEQTIQMEPQEQQVLYELYTEVAEEQGWQPESRTLP